MRKNIVLIISLIMIIAFVGIYLLENYKEDPPKEAGSNNEQRFYMFPREELDQLILTFGKSDEEIIISQDESDQWIVSGAKEEISQLKVNQVIQFIYGLVGTLKESVSLEELQIFENGQDSITFINNSGNKTVVNIGLKNDEESVYYTTFNDSDDIYEVDAEFIVQLPKTIDELYDRSIITIKQEQLNKIIIDNSIQTIHLSTDSPYSKEETRTNLSGWFMHQPYKNVYSVKYQKMEDMIFGMQKIEWSKVISESNNDLQEYGLDDSNFNITFVTDESEEVIIIGAPATATTHYAMKKGDNVIFTIENELLHPYRYKAFDIVEKFVKIIAIDVLEELKINVKNEEEIMITVDHQENPVFYINGKTIEDKVFRGLYRDIAGLSVEKEISKSFSYKDPEATMNFVIHDEKLGKKELLVEFINFDKENFAIFIDKKADFIMKKESFQRMLTSIYDVL